MRYQTGSKNIVANVWSDAAREAAIQSRRSGHGVEAEQASTQQEHTTAAAYHTEASEMFHKAGKAAGADAHVAAARAHQSAATGIRKGAADTETRSSQARRASKTAHAYQR